MNACDQRILFTVGVNSTNDLSIHGGPDDPQELLELLKFLTRHVKNAIIIDHTKKELPN